MAIQDFSWAAGLRDVKIIDSTDTEFDVNAVVSVDAEPEQDITEIRGDDEVKTNFVTGMRENLTITFNSISFDALAAITGNTVTEEATTPPLGHEMPLGTDSQGNPPFVKVQASSTAKNGDGTAMTLMKVWHKVQFTSVRINQAGESEVSCECEAVAYKTDTDIDGTTALSPARIATLSVKGAGV